ncbi:MAG TPA: DNA polymerase/3'-5' exonuclease PolX [Chlamydiales bacterium]|nr:DNA polymerase/3'-5' exonuclease PolX [Chlamydiales bacterium]
MNKREIAAVLEEIATLLELKGENPFRIRAYRNGARALLNIDEDLADLIKAEKLTEYEGIGDHLAQKITELYETGHLPEYEKLRKKTPPGLLQLMQVQGLGPKKVKVLYQKLKIHNLADLKKAAEAGKIAKLSGFGAKTEKNILHSLEHRESYQKRHLWWEAEQIATPILEKLKKIKGVKEAEICGSLRRKLETIGDLDFLVATDNPKPAMEWFISQASHVIAQGETKSSIRLSNGMQADLRIVSPSQYIYALVYFTGSKDHNIKIRVRSLKKGWSLSEYGFESEKKMAMPKIKDEEGLYKAIGLSYIPPEIRENLGEIEAAEKKSIPHLIEPQDIRGTFHNHTTASDGRNTLKEMVAAAQKLGWEYIGISDHSKSSFQANGLSAERLLEQIETIRKLNASKEFKIHIFAGLECDILADGTLDFPAKILSKLDYVIASVHSSLTQDEKTMTKRIIKALENPYTTMLGHPTGRLLLKREPYAVNLSKVIDAAIANKKIIELNGNPMRLDLDWRLWHAASKKGLRCCVNTDAHAVDQHAFYLAGVNIARKGWLTKNEVINTLPLDKVIRSLK